MCLLVESGKRLNGNSVEPNLFRILLRFTHLTKFTDLADKWECIC